jgi:diphosphomevalonate decarboxylase
MSNKSSVIAPANIAFIKYWGKRDEKLLIPANDNISMTLSDCLTTTTIELDQSLTSDHIEVKFFNKDYEILDKNSIKSKNVYDQVERIRNLAGSNIFVRIKSANNFPADAGIASSASGFAALTSALLLVYGLEDKFNDKKELSRQIRLCGSGSAVRSVYGGYVEFLTAEEHEDSYARQIADENHWDLVDIVAIIDEEKKKYSSSSGHNIANSSPYFQTRLIEMQKRIADCREAIMTKNFKKLGECIEAESISLHTIMMTSNPPILYWAPGSISIIKELQKWREEDGLLAYQTMDAGANVHVICQAKDQEEVNNRLKNNKFVKWTIVNKPTHGVIRSENHLF